MLKTLNLEITNECDTRLTQKALIVVNEFFNKKKKRILNGKKLKIIIPKNFEQSYNKFSFDKSTSNEKTEHLQGVFLPSDDPDYQEFVIIIQENVVSNNTDSVKTLYHELTHVIDFASYFKSYGNLCFAEEKIKTDNYFYEFFLWTEFNAKRRGLIRFKREMKNNFMSIDMLRTTQEFQNIIAYETSELNAYYELMHFLARISVFEASEKDSIIFPREWLSEFLSIDLIRLFRMLKRTDCFKKFDRNKKKFRELLGLKYTNSYIC